MGIRRLLNDGTYLACFPLHEGRYDQDNEDKTQTDRRVGGSPYIYTYNILVHARDFFVKIKPKPTHIIYVAGFLFQTT